MRRKGFNSTSLSNYSKCNLKALHLKNLWNPYGVWADVGNRLFFTNQNTNLINTIQKTTPVIRRISLW
jgi:hypothetical protein